MKRRYYPWGGVLAGISSKAAGKLSNRNQYNGGNEKQSEEFSDGSGLEMYDAVHRMYDPQLGRFWQQDPLSGLSYHMSPYVFANNNPILLNDPLGLTSDSTKAPGFENSTTGAKVLPEVTVKNTPKHSSSNGSAGFYWPTIRKQQGEWNDRMFARQRDNQPLLQGNEPSWVVDQLPFHKRNFAATQDYREMSLAAVLAIASPTLIVGLAPESITAASSFYSQLSAEYFERSLVLHMQSNLALDWAKRKVLGAILGGAVSAFGKDALYNRTLWGISKEMNTYRAPLNGQTIPKIIDQAVKQIDKLDKH